MQPRIPARLERSDRGYPSPSVLQGTGLLWRKDCKNFPHFLYEERQESLYVEISRYRILWLLAENLILLFFVQILESLIEQGFQHSRRRLYFRSERLPVYWLVSI